MKKFLKQETTDHENKMVEAYMLFTESEIADFPDNELAQTRERIWNNIDRRRDKGIGRFLRNHQWLRVAAVWAVIATLSISAYQFRYELLDRIAPITWIAVQTGPHEIRQLQLPDGTAVSLAQQSRISYPERYRGKERPVKLEGTAFFNVTQNDRQPFTVTSGALNVKVLGTSFEIRNTPATPNVQITVATGKVQVSQHHRQLAILTSNQQMKYNGDPTQLTLRKLPDTAAEISWTQNALVFNDTRLHEVFKVLREHYAMKIVVMPTAVTKEATFSGVFSSSETGRDVLEIICLSVGLQYRINHDSTVVIKK